MLVYTKLIWGKLITFSIKPFFFKKGKKKESDLIKTLDPLSIKFSINLSWYLLIISGINELIYSPFKLF